MPRCSMAKSQKRGLISQHGSTKARHKTLLATYAGFRHTFAALGCHGLENSLIESGLERQNWTPESWRAVSLVVIRQSTRTRSGDTEIMMPRIELNKICI